MKKNLSIFLLIIILFGMFSGCSEENNSNKGNANDDQDYSVAIAMLYGNHANNAVYEIPILDFDKGYIDENNSPFLHEKYKIVGLRGIIIDGNPTECKSDELEEFFDNFDIAAKNRRYKATKKYLEALPEKLANKYANDEEVDTLEAFFVASNYFEQVSNATERRIIVVDSGLTTTGALDFIKNDNLNSILKQNEDLSEDQLNSFIDELYENKEIPDLSNTKILWYGLGQVGENQQELSKKQINNLKLLWKKILEQSGVSDIDFITVNESNSLISNNAMQLPTVSTVFFNEAIAMNDDSLGFKEDSEEFTNDSNEIRTELLSGFVNEGIRNGLLIVGTTSTGGGSSDGIELSNKRAQAVKDELVKLGVPSNKIKILGLGVKSHKYNEEEFVNGNYERDSEAAKENRSVYIMSQNSEEAKLFYKDYENINQ